MGPLVLVDSDILVYKVAFSVETPIYVVKGGIYKRYGYAKLIANNKNAEVFKRTHKGSEAELRANLEQVLELTIQDLGQNEFKHYLTSSKVTKNFRDDIATILPYKGNRSKSERPWYYNKMRSILHTEYGAELSEGQEADDAITIKHFELFKQNRNYESSIIWTIDKDFKQVPGWQYNYDKKIFQYIQEEQALKNFYSQILTGDVTDNIPGLYKLLVINKREEEAKKLVYGHYIKNFEKEIEKLSPKQTFEHVRNMYKKYDFGYKEISEIGNLLWLRRYKDQLWSDDFYSEDK